MNGIVQALKETGVFYAATVEGDQPRVRPFGGVIDYNGKAYFCTNNTKACFRQLLANPKTEICGMKPDGSWVRVSGRLIREDNDAVRAAFLEASPGLKNRYSIGDGIFEVFRLEDAVACLYTMGADPVEIIE